MAIATQRILIGSDCRAVLCNGYEFSGVEIPYCYSPPANPCAGRDAQGYGRKIPTAHLVKLNGRWRRVYVCCSASSGTAYVATRNGDWICVDG